MKITFISFLLVLSVVGCSSHQHESEKPAQKQAQTFEGTTDPNAQYNRVISMVKADPKLNQDQKNNLVSLVDRYVEKSKSVKKEQSQYRAMLIDEMLKDDDGRSEKITSAKNGLQKINTDNNKNLELFIRDFKSYSGAAAKSQQATMLEASGMRM